MDNEEKILSVLETLTDTVTQLTGTVAQLSDKVAEMGDGIESINVRLDGIDERLDGIDERLTKLECDVRDIKEDAAITREATNQLCDWAEQAGNVIGIMPGWRESA